MLKWFWRGAAAILALCLVATTASLVDFWRLGEDALALGAAGGRIHAVAEAPLNTLEATLAHGVFERTWDRRAFPCRSFSPALSGSVADMTATSLMRSFRSDRTMTNHLRRASAACLLDLRYSDAVLLRLWLEHVAIGEATGANAAALELFGKPAGELDSDESARLAALIWSPSLIRNPSAWRDRTDWLKARAASAPAN